MILYNHYVCHINCLYSDTTLNEKPTKLDV